jgi:hypothetical protein
MVADGDPESSSLDDRRFILIGFLPKGPQTHGST